MFVHVCTGADNGYSDKLFAILKITQPYIEGHLIKRYKRFLADVELTNGEVITAHTGNTGSMKGCSDPGSRVWLYDSENPKRKYRYSWDLVEDLSGNLIGIHTTRANKLVHEAIDNGVIEELKNYTDIRPEVKYLDSNTRFDFLLTNQDQSALCFVEVKNVTAKRDSDIAIFPDAKTERGRKHLQTLIDAVEHGYRSVIFFCIQRSDVSVFKPADEIDPEYGELLRKAYGLGVEAFAYKAYLSPDEIYLNVAIPVILE